MFEGWDPDDEGLHGAFQDWTMGIAAGSAAYREPRINAMLKKVLTVVHRGSDPGAAGGQRLRGLSDGHARNAP